MNYHLTVLSPVHIGSGTSLTPLDFAWVDDRIAVIELECLLHADPHRAKDFATQVAAQPARFSLTDCFTPAELATPAVQRYRLYADAAGAAFREACKAAGGAAIAETLKTACDEQPYIPGSSLKGAFRTAWAYACLRDDDTLLQSLRGRLDRIDWRQADDVVDDLVFWGARRSPQFDCFRSVSVSDSAPAAISDDALALGALRTLSLYERQRPERPRQGTMFKQLEAIRRNLSAADRSPLKPGAFFCEMLPAGSALRGTMTIDDALVRHAAVGRMLRWTNRQKHRLSVEELFRAANTFALDVCDWELKFFETFVHGLDVTPVVNFYQRLRARIQQAGSRQGVVCVGRGAGWHKRTIGMLAANAGDVPFRTFRKNFRLAPHRLQFPYPKSRQLLMASTGHVHAPSGWIRVECS